MLSVITPTDRERENIEPLLTRLAAIRERLGEPLEVLVVDNGSLDGTAALAQEFLRQKQLGRVIEQSSLGGLAQAVCEGIEHANGDLIGVMDADLSHPPELLPVLVESIRSGCEIAVASRYVPGGGVADWPRPRRILSRLGNALARPLAGVADATSGYFVCQATLLKPLALRPRGFKILLEILVRGHARRVQEVPYVFVNRRRGRSKLRGRVLWSCGVQLLSLYAYRLTH